MPYIETLDPTTGVSTPKDFESLPEDIYDLPALDELDDLMTLPILNSQDNCYSFLFSGSTNLPSAGPSSAYQTPWLITSNAGDPLCLSPPVTQLEDDLVRRMNRGVDLPETEDFIFYDGDEIFITAPCPLTPPVSPHSANFGTPPRLKSPTATRFNLDQLLKHPSHSSVPFQSLRHIRPPMISSY